MSADAQTPPAEAPPPSALKKQLPFIIALVGGLGAGGASGAFFVGPAMAKGIAPAVAATAAAGGESREAAPEGEGEAAGGEHAGKEGAAAKQVYTLDNLVLNPAESGGTRFLLLSIAFESSDGALIEEMKARDAELRDVVLVTLGAKTVEQLADVKVREGMKQELATAALKLFKKKSSARVYFPQFVIQ